MFWIICVLHLAVIDTLLVSHLALLFSFYHYCVYTFVHDAFCVACIVGSTASSIEGLWELHPRRLSEAGLSRHSGITITSLFVKKSCFLI